MFSDRIVDAHCLVHIGESRLTIVSMELGPLRLKFIFIATFRYAVVTQRHPGWSRYSYLWATHNTPTSFNSWMPSGSITSSNTAKNQVTSPYYSVHLVRGNSPPDNRRMFGGRLSGGLKSYDLYTYTYT